MLKISWSPLYCHPLPEGHRFPMEKYELIPEQLIYEGSIREEQLYDPGEVGEEVLLLTHEAEYWHRLKNGLLSRREERRTGFPHSPRLVQRELNITMGTLQNIRYARQYGIAMNVAGGTHHAYTDRGEGFCLLNDFAVGVNYFRSRGELGKVLIVDLDVHQGNGTAQIFRDDPGVFTFSMHCEANYPLKKEHSDLDLALPVGTGDDVYLKLLKETLPRLIDEVEPELICYLPGVDVLATDKLGKLALSREGCKARDAFVFQTCHRHKIPVAVALGGGYSPGIRDIIEAHCNTFRLAMELWG